MIEPQIVVVGAGGLGREVYEFAEDSGCVVRGFIDDNLRALDVPVPVRVIGTTMSMIDRPPDVEFVIAVGDYGARRRLALAVAAAGGAATYRYPSDVLRVHSGVYR